MNLIDIFSFVLLLATVGYIAYIFNNRNKIERWGRKVLILIVVGLVLCSFVVMRDDYVLAMQGGVGVFALNSIQIQLAYGLATVIVISALICLFSKNQKHKRILFMVISFLVVMKTLLIEISRLLG